MSKQASHKQKRYELTHSVIVHVPGLLLMMYSTRELADFKSSSINLMHADTYVTNSTPT